MQAVLVSLISFISTLFGGLFAARYREKLHYIISFSAGVLIAVCFFDILPEIFAITTEKGLSITPALIAIVGGFIFIHALEKLAVIHTAHESEYADHKHPVVGIVGAGGLAFHSFTYDYGWYR
jgi:ZIP family zinc transporter